MQKTFSLQIYSQGYCVIIIHHSHEIIPTGGELCSFPSHGNDSNFMKRQARPTTMSFSCPLLLLPSTTTFIMPGTFPYLLAMLLLPAPTVVMNTSTSCCDGHLRQPFSNYSISHHIVEICLAFKEPETGNKVVNIFWKLAGIFLFNPFRKSIGCHT